MAASLLQTDTAVTVAPGLDRQVRCVILYHSDTSHVVQPKGSTQYVCDSNCPQWVSYNICLHTVAVAQLNNVLGEFLEWYVVICSSTKPHYFGNDWNATRERAKRQLGTKVNNKNHHFITTFSSRSANASCHASPPSKPRHLQLVWLCFKLSTVCQSNNYSSPLVQPLPSATTSCSAQPSASPEFYSTPLQQPFASSTTFTSCPFQVPHFQLLRIPIHSTSRLLVETSIIAKAAE